MQESFKLIFTNDIIGYYEGRDTSFFSDQIPVKTLLLYYPNSECPSCDVGHVFNYAALINYAKENPSELAVKFLFTIKNSEAIDEVRLSTITYPIGIPIYMDTTGGFMASNPKLINDKRVVALVVDSKDSVLFSDINAKNKKEFEQFGKKLNGLIPK